MEEEINNSINFLDITIHKTDQNFSFRIYRKPTVPDIIILSDSCHPQENNMAAIRYLANRIITYLIDDTNKIHEYCTAKQILINNQYYTKILDEVLEKVTVINNIKRNN